MSDEELVDEHGTMRFFTPSSEKSQPITFNTLQETGAGKDFDPSEDSWTLRGENFVLAKRTLVGVTDMEATVQFPDDATDIPETGATVRLEHYAVGLDGRITELPGFLVSSRYQCGFYVAINMIGDGSPKPVQKRHESATVIDVAETLASYVTQDSGQRVVLESVGTLEEAERAVLERAPQGSTWRLFEWNKGRITVQRHREDGAWFLSSTRMGDQWYGDNVCIRDKETGEPWPHDIGIRWYSELTNTVAVVKRNPNGIAIHDDYGNLLEGTLPASLEVIPQPAPPTGIINKPGHRTLEERAIEAARVVKAEQNGGADQRGIHVGSPDIPDLSHWNCETPKSEQSTGATCPDCNGTGEYRGLIKVETCETCGGKGKA